MTLRLVRSELVVATRNVGKVRELREVFAELPVDLLSLEDFAKRRGVPLSVLPDPVESAATFDGNATIKAREYATACDAWVLADDSGLEVDALDGAPGVHSARYAGEGATDAANNHKLLAALADVENRGARFRCVLVLADEVGEVIHITHGTCEGTLLRAPRGSGGFGYDPLFVADGETLTMAELPPARKAELSHRGAASRAMCEHLARTRAFG